MIKMSIVAVLATLCQAHRLLVINDIHLNNTYSETPSLGKYGHYGYDSPMELLELILKDAQE